MTRRRIIVVLLLLVGIALAIQAAVGQLDVSAQKALVESRLSEAFGLEVRIEGEFELAAFPRPHLRVGELRVANLPGSPSPHLLEVGELSFGFELVPLLWGLLELERVSVRDATVHIEPDAAGRIDMHHELPSLAELPEPETDARLRVELDTLEVSGLRVFYRDPASGDVHAAVLEQFTLESPDPGEPLSFHLRGSTTTGAYSASTACGSPRRGARSAASSRARSRTCRSSAASISSSHSWRTTCGASESSPNIALRWVAAEACRRRSRIAGGRSRSTASACCEAPMARSFSKRAAGTST